MVVDGQKDDAIREQLAKLEHDTDMTAASNFATAQNWEKINNYLGLSIIILSSIATVIGASSGSSNAISIQSTNLQVVYTVISSAVAALGSVLTFLKPSERGARYREFGNKQKLLRNKIRVYRTVSIDFAPSPTERHAKLEAFILEKDTLNSDNPPIARWAFRRATKDLEEKANRRSKTQSLAA